MLQNLDRITFDLQIMGGKACVRGMRVPVSLILNLLANGKTAEEIIDDYPYLEPEDIQQSMLYAAWLSQDKIIPLPPKRERNRFMKFLADMGISPKTVQWLINQGYDAIHLLDEGLEKLPDEKILDKAQAEKRVILTVDLDFGTLLAIAKISFPSVVIFRLNNASRDVIETRLRIVLEKCLQDLEAGAILSVDDEKIRVRYLPI